MCPWLVWICMGKGMKTGVFSLFCLFMNLCPLWPNVSQVTVNDLFPVHGRTFVCVVTIIFPLAES
jgi:hypothetical protein